MDTNAPGSQTKSLKGGPLQAELLGGNGIADKYLIFPQIANLESMKTYEGTQDIHVLIIGDHITGFAAF
jgi:glutaryl-CoA dehydrogenase